MTNSLWSIVLAAGKGRRLASVTGNRPKQFWAPRGDRTLLEHTIDRMAPLTPAGRVVTVVDRSQRLYTNAIETRTSLGRVVYQPEDRGTAAGVLLGLMETDASADTIVVLTPSDHGIARPDVFHHGLRDVISEVERGHADLVMLAVTPRSPSGDLGWIVPSSACVAGSDRLRPVERFVEKPTPDRAVELFAAGAAWSTMVMVARRKSLLDLYRTHLLWLAQVFARAQRVPGNLRDAFLAEHYHEMTSADFSLAIS